MTQETDRDDVALQQHPPELETPDPSRLSLPVPHATCCRSPMTLFFSSRSSAHCCCCCFSSCHSSCGMVVSLAKAHLEVISSNLRALDLASFSSFSTLQAARSTGQTGSWGRAAEASGGLELAGVETPRDCFALGPSPEEAPGPDRFFSLPFNLFL